MPADPDTGIACWNISQFFQQQTVECTGFFFGQIPTCFAVERPNSDKAVDQVVAVVKFAHVTGSRPAVRGIFADNFFQDVIQCHQSLDVSVFIDNQAHLSFPGLEFEQLLGEPGALRNEVGFAHRTFQVVKGEGAVCKLGDDRSDMQQTLHLVDTLPENRQACIDGLG